MAVYLSKKQLADAAGYSTQRLYEINRALPENMRFYKEGEGGKYDLAFFVQQWVAYNIDRELGGETDDLDAVKARHEKIKTRKTRLEVLRMEGKLVDVKDVSRLWSEIANRVKQSLLNLPSTMAPMVQGMENIEAITNIMYSEISTALNDIADTPLPEYAYTDDEEDDEEDNDEEV